VRRVPNRVQDLLHVEVPVVQAPMTYIARAGLAAAVSEAGGLGVVETLTEEGRADLARMRDLTDEPCAANLLVQGWKDDPSIVDVLCTGLAERAATHHGKLLGDITAPYFASDLEASVANTGQVSARIEGVEPVADVVRRTWDGCRAALESAGRRLA
jgi:hypothetical protein